jgi:hypothetical protein
MDVICLVSKVKEAYDPTPSISDINRSRMNHDAILYPHAASRTNDNFVTLGEFRGDFKVYHNASPRRDGDIAGAEEVKTGIVLVSKLGQTSSLREPFEAYHDLFHRASTFLIIL